MKFILRGGPADGLEVEDSETYPIGEVLVPIYQRREAYQFGALPDDLEPLWCAKYQLSSDGKGDFLGWEKH